jgi:hypothetical protein
MKIRIIESKLSNTTFGEYELLEKGDMNELKGGQKKPIFPNCRKLCICRGSGGLCVIRIGLVEDDMPDDVDIKIEY